MVEAMYERSPSYFKQFQKKFGFKNVDKKTDITSLINYAECPLFEFKFCLVATNHFHILIDSSTDNGFTKQNKSFAVPCLSKILNTYFQFLQNWKPT